MLSKFKLVNHTGLKGLHYQGDFIPFEKIDDALAEKLIGKTHVLERLADVATAPVLLTVVEAVPAEELPAAVSRKSKN